MMPDTPTTAKCVSRSVRGHQAGIIENLPACQHPPMEALQGCRRLHAELAGEADADTPVLCQRVADATGLVERDHVVGGVVLIHRVLYHERPDLTHDLHVAAET